MAIDLYWDNDEKTTLLCIFEAHWTWKELFATLRTIKMMTDELSYEVAALIDVRKGVNFPDGIFTPQTVDNVRQMLSWGAGGTGPILIIGANAFIKTIYKTMLSIDPQALANVHFVDTVREAREILAAQQTV